MFECLVSLALLVGTEPARALRPDMTAWGPVYSMDVKEDLTVKGTEQKERRAGVRAKMPIPVQICIEGEDEVVEYTTTNVSAGGIFIPTDSPHPTGTRLDLQLYLEPLGLTIGAKGWVVRSIPVPEDESAPAGMGIQFATEGRIGWDFLKNLIQGEIRAASSSAG
ncbi:MAG: PilZ domain-containing protein [Planctomycetota bacterium]|nr:PilZ domain-containing protein [Planctomycetota bacterium]